MICIARQCPFSSVRFLNAWDLALKLQVSLVNFSLSLSNDVLISDVLFLILMTTGGAWSDLNSCHFRTPEPTLCIHWLGAFVDPNIARMRWEVIESQSPKLWSSYYINEILWLKTVQPRSANMMDISGFVCILYHTRHKIKYGVITFNTTMYVNNFLKRDHGNVTFSFWTSRELKPFFTESLWNEARTSIPVLRCQTTSRNIEGHSYFIFVSSLQVHYL
jgi:hypothetical protein